MSRSYPLVAMLVVLAGCSGALGGGDTPTRTVTPVAVPSGDGSSGFPPGVSGGVLSDPDALLVAHDAALSGVGHTRVRTERMADDGDLRWAIEVRTRVGPSGRRHTVVVSDGPHQPPVVQSGTTRIERYLGPTGAWVAVWRDGERRVTRAPGDDSLARPNLGSVFGGVRLRVVGRERADGELRFRLRGATVRDDRSLDAVTPYHDPVNPRLRATVAADGVVHAYRLTYAVADPPYISEQRYTRRFRVEAVGDTTVERPAWVPTNQTTTGAGTP